MGYLPRATPAMPGGSKSFLTDYPMAKVYFVYGGTRRMREDKIEIIPLVEILKSLRVML